MLDREETIKKTLGSKYNMAPEVIFNKPYNSKADIWSATVVIFTLLTGGILPYDGKDVTEIGKNIKIKNIDKILKSRKFSNLSKEAKDFIRLGLQFEPTSRGDAKQMINHQWLTEIEWPQNIKD